MQVQALGKSATDKTRKAANSTIEALNIASENTELMSDVMGSLAGIVEQASQPDLSPARRDTLEQEARDLITEIERRSASSTSSGEKPLAGDAITFAVEDSLERQLKVLLPSDAKESFGLNTFELSTAEQILRTRENVAKARARLENLKGAVNDAREQVNAILSQVETAKQNTEAAAASIRDVEEAAKLSDRLRGSINVAPQQAVQSSQLGSQALRLLE